MSLPSTVKPVGPLSHHRQTSNMAATMTCFFLATTGLIGPTMAWTFGSLSFARKIAPSKLFLGTEAEERLEPATSIPPAQRRDRGSYPLGRREALSRGLIAGGVGAASALAPPEPSLGEAARVQDFQPPPSSPKSGGALSLLSKYDPDDYTTLPSLGRTVFPPPFLPPLKNRATYRYPLGRGAWALEQLLAFKNVTATIRTNVIKLDDGGLWVCGPLWPTEEYCALLDELGPVRHAVLPTNALEHKAPMGQFLRKYPDAEVWISPGQYGPFGECGIVTEDMAEAEIRSIVRKAAKTMGHRVDGILPAKRSPANDSKTTGSKVGNMFPPWTDEFDMAVLCVELPENAGPVSECAFVHRPTRTLVVADAVICVPRVAVDGAAKSSDSFPLQPIFSTYYDESALSDPTFWPRTVLQAVFLPLRAESDVSGAASYPGYDALAGRLVRAPILRAFGDARAPDAIREWVDRIAGLGDFDRIVAAHFASPIDAGPDRFARAFSHLDRGASLDDVSAALPISCRDWSTLNSLNDFIEGNGLGAPVVFDFQRGCTE